LAPAVALGQGQWNWQWRDPSLTSWRLGPGEGAGRSIGGPGQTGVLELQNVSLDAALKALTNRAGLRITYSQAILPKGKRVTLKAGDIAVVTALTEMLFRSGLDVVVDQDGTLALVRCKHQAPRAEVQDSGTIVGTVTDKATRAPIAGATVMVEGTEPTRPRTLTGVTASPIVLAGTYTVRVRYIGYAPLRASVPVSADSEAAADFALTSRCRCWMR